MRIFLCGDVMTGRGIDQIMPRACDPVLYEPHMRSALGYLALAERASGEIPRPASFEYVWGDALDVIAARRPDFRIINLETSITDDGTHEPKGINYRMHPGNIGCITAAEIDCCVLANNHVLDWGVSGLLDTLAALQPAGVTVAGAGVDRNAAAAPALLQGSAGRLLVFAFAYSSSGVPDHWAAKPARPGVNFLRSLGPGSGTKIAADIEAWRQPGDLVLVSLHWGPNWGYDIPQLHQAFARELIDRARVDIVHGHSSHHPLAIEVHAGKLILYGCGDFINDYEGISGYAEYRPNLVLAYFVELDPRGRLLALELAPFRLQRFQLVRASPSETAWLCRVLDRECRRFRGHMRMGDSGLRLLSENEGG
ncbi:CapA family protein [Pseudaminobacter sp. 19-2017]|uniref:CapA family protein n=1 Tax=Pseudaminobacter soli (ex Zhang et al. 2022) TaxID=2831468 RepID=A0A942DXX0_9HYPH|nr:CapA family protein [Pseudaminobacter soli]MBS3650229.1 CapA family protein [Pseudaminobacter soli]